jgi:hypothetical protein
LAKRRALRLSHLNGAAAVALTDQRAIAGRARAVCGSP